MTGQKAAILRRLYQRRAVPCGIDRDAGTCSLTK